MIASSPDFQKIGLLGGSFNPAHAGHREISLTALDRLGLDAVWWLVTPGNPLKDQAQYAEYDERMRVARRVAKDPRIVVSDFERRRGLQYTVDTIDAVVSDFPGMRFVWLMGADSLATFHKWKDWRRIAEQVAIAVFGRPGYAGAALESDAATALAHFRIDADAAKALPGGDPPIWTFIEETENPLSSTAIRQERSKKETSLHVTDATQPKLQAPFGPLAFYLNLEPALSDFKSDVIEGLSKSQKSISPMYFYDAYGSRLFEQITRLDAYYPTRTERSIMIENASAIGDAIGESVAIIEYGSGSANKIRRLLGLLHDPVAYVAMDISGDHLVESMSALAEEVSDIPIGGICADFNETIALPKDCVPPAKKWLGYFPGSTLGNFTPEMAAAFLKRASDTLGKDSAMLIGIDLYKDEKILERAYDDPEGVTAAFNLNLLTRMRAELGAELDIDHFDHRAVVNHEERRVEMHLRAKVETTIKVGGRAFSFSEGETLHTENSYKYSLSQFERLLDKTPWKLDRVWTDVNEWFAACLLSNT
ncbi:MAG: L-histidine N(alpha)-methyltransferase [Pseudomonadota bacterium]